MISFVNGMNYSVIEGFWKFGNGVLVTIMNVYYSGTLQEKKEVWKEISAVIMNQLLKA